MFDILPYIYALLAGAVIAVYVYRWYEKRKANERLRLLDEMAAGAKRLAALDKNEDAAEIAARAAREAVRLDEVKTAVQDLK